MTPYGTLFDKVFTRFDAEKIHSRAAAAIRLGGRRYGYAVSHPTRSARWG